VGDFQINNILPSILFGNFWLHRYMGRYKYRKDILRLEGRPLWSRLNYPLPNPIEEPILKKLV
jgi:hypothetical protein